ncbi:MAG: chromate transporter [Eubacteriales bacterium]|nr:chromate transporter [Eubacteriales bacterium]
MPPVKDSKAQPMSLWTFFLSCFKISAFTLGGGYVIVPLQKRRFCDELRWIEEEKILDLVAMAQSAPGPVAINASTLMGYHLFGLKGALLAALATMLPPLIILSVISLFYAAVADNPLLRAILRGMQAAVAALIVYTVGDLTYKLWLKKHPLQLGILAVALVLALFVKINVVLIIFLAALVAAASYFLSNKHKEAR